MVQRKNENNAHKKLTKKEADNVALENELTVIQTRVAREKEEKGASKIQKLGKHPRIGSL